MTRNLVRLCAVVLILGTADVADAAGARVVWLASSDSRITGYNVYLRQAGSPYGSPRNAGMPTPGADGKQAYVVTGLTQGATYYFAIAAYTAAGKRSPISEELSIGPLNPCANDICTSLSNCQTVVLPDGTACGDDLFCNGSERCAAGACVGGQAPNCDDGRPCTADSCDENVARCRHVGAQCCPACDFSDPCQAEDCLTGECGTAVGYPLLTRRLSLSTTAMGAKLKARGMFTPDFPLEPKKTGVTLEIADTFGEILYSATVRGFWIVESREGLRYRYVVPQSEAIPLGGVTQLSLKNRGGQWLVTVYAVSSDLTALLAHEELTWTVRIGNQCTREIRVPCKSLGTRTSCNPVSSRGL